MKTIYCKILNINYKFRGSAAINHERFSFKMEEDLIDGLAREMKR